MTPTRLLVLTLGLAACEVPSPAPSVWVTIPPASTVEAVADTLAAHGVIPSAPAFVRFARIGRRHLGIQAGTYAFRPRSAMGAVLVQLRRGTPPVIPIDVRPGMMLSELIPMLAHHLDLDEADLRNATRDPILVDRLQARGSDVEGYLFPTTYRVPAAADARFVIGMMIDTFEVHWQHTWHSRHAGSDLTRDEVITLASIVEGEGPHDDDWRHVAAVYRNRLSRNMRLQADPTVVYALGTRRRLLFRDYQVSSPFNTYRHDGLPPSPINQPSDRAIAAVLYPAATDHLYLVARPDGRHVFSRSYEEHLLATRRVRR